MTLKIPVTAEDHVQGPETALITLVEYGDYECPYCGQAYPVVKKLQDHFGDNLRFVFRNFPLSEMHPHAAVAAEAAEFAATKGLFWEMHDLIYENQNILSISTLLELAKTLHLPTKEFQETIENKTYKNKIQKDFLGGVRSAVNGTPTFFINDQRYNGSPDFKSFVSVLESVLVQ